MGIDDCGNCYICYNSSVHSYEFQRELDNQESKLKDIEVLLKFDRIQEAIIDNQGFLSSKFRIRTV